MKKGAVAIIGAGPAGLASAYIFAQAGIKVDIYDIGKNIGGLSLSFKLWGKTVELGPHFLEFINTKEVKSLIYDPYQSDFILYNRNTKIHLNESLFNYPPRPFNIMANIGIVSSVRLVFSMLRANLKKSSYLDMKTAEDLSVNCTGMFIHNMFIKDYSEKIWGLSCKDISPVYLQRLIGYANKGFQLFSVVKKFLPEKSVSYTHPKNGMTTVWNKLATSIKANGGTFYLSQKINQLLIDDNNNMNGLELENGEKRQYDHIIATIPVLALAPLIPDKTEELNSIMSTIQRRSVVSAYIKVNGESPFDEQCIFLYNKNIKATKVTNFSNFPRNESDNDSHVILFEYWCTYGDELWGSDDTELLAILKQDIVNLHKIMPVFEILEMEVKRLKSIYPIPDISYYDKISQAQAITNNLNNFSYVGRDASGHFNYSTAESMHDSIILSKSLLEKCSKEWC